MEPQPQKVALEPDTSAPVMEADAKLDEVMLAMDVVDTLRHERMLITRDINTEMRRESLVDRLRDIYRGQGIEVPDDILMDGVKALEEERFRYQPPPDTFGTKLARIYVNRKRWLPGVFAAALGALLLAGGGLMFQQQQAASEARIERVLGELPADFESAYQAALATDPVPEALSRIESLYASGLAEIEASDVGDAEAQLEDLRELTTQLDLSYDLEIINRSGEYSGVQWDNLPYIIVQAVGSDGAPISIPVTSTVTGRTAEVSTFGVQVSADSFDEVLSDYSDNEVVDAADFGTKERGELEADYVFDVRSGRIVDSGKWSVR